MKAAITLFSFALFAAGAAQAQLVETPSTRLEAETGGRFGPLAAGFKRYSPLYGGNETANPNDRQFHGFRTDPRLVIGVAFNDYLALETGYSHLRDEGFHKIDGGAVESAVAAGALGVKSHTTYVAAKLTVPVNERLSAYGKLGIAHSEAKNDGFLPRHHPLFGTSGRGAYGAVGAKYKLNDKATLSGEVVKNGSATNFGRASNASGVKGSIGLGF
ncbi:MAG: outer membrane beta-barrel protein [Telluria sp.]